MLQCGPTYMKLEFTWKNRSLNHLYSSPYVGCIGGCDPRFLQTLNINIGSHSATSQNVNNSNDSGFSSSSRSTSDSIPRPQQSTGRGRPQQRIDVATRPNVAPRTGNSTVTNWFNATSESGIGSQLSRPSGQGSRNSASQPNPNSDDNHVTCNCGDAAILLTVRKASPNMGKNFFLY